MQVSNEVVMLKKKVHISFHILVSVHVDSNLVSTSKINTPVGSYFKGADQFKLAQIVVIS